MAQYGFGLVGCGMIAEFHAKAISEIAKAKLVAVSDCIPASAERMGKAYGVPFYSDYNEMVKRDDVHIVNICTPSGAHMEPALAAAKARKHVAVEKPLEITLKRCDKVIKACEKAGVKLATFFPSRFTPCNQLLKKTLESGRFGRVTLGDVYNKWWRTQQYYDSGGWRGTWALDGGGSLMNQAVHAIDLLQWMMGPVKSIDGFTAMLCHERIEVEDTAVAILHFESGALGVIEGTTSVYPGLLRRLEIHGSKGTVILEQDTVKTWQFEQEQPEDAAVRKDFGDKPAGPGAVADPRDISHLGHRKQIEDFIEAVEQNRRPLVDGPEGRKAVEIICAIYKAAQTGKRVNLPLKP
ncbi:MAG: Gfo/Idh/MocA family oxidoreductase [Planctomycetes bacterium]|nr:Gfo/Idh/MocA family oxidoreductase [Planctomycetota bacterium]